MRHLPFFISSNRPTDCHVMQDTMEEHSFNEVLGEQLQRAPYLIASLFLHFLIGLFVMGILVLTAKQETPPPQFVAAAAEPPPVIEEDPIVEPIVETPLIPEPVVNDIPVETEEPSPTLEDDGDPEMTAKEPLEAHEWNGVVGLGGGAGGNQGSRGARVVQEAPHPPKPQLQVACSGSKTINRRVAFGMRMGSCTTISLLIKQRATARATPSMTSA